MDPCPSPAVDPHARSTGVDAWFGLGGGARRRLLGPWGTLKLEFGMDLGGFEVCGCEYTEGFLVLISSDIVTQFDKRL